MKGPVVGNDGYTLVEALVAFAILSGALVVSFESFSSGLRNLAAVERRTAEIAAARHAIDELAMRSYLTAGRITGKIGNRQWELVVTPISLDGAQGATVRHPFRVSFQIVGRDNAREPVLETVLLAPEAPQ